jgi:hypothetical protein
MVDSNSVVSKTENAIEPVDNPVGHRDDYVNALTYFPKANARPGSLVASAKRTSFIFKSPMESVSRETKPSIEPEPYWIENVVPLALYVDEDDESYFAWRKHAIEVHWELGTQRLLELEMRYKINSYLEQVTGAYPVSRMTLNWTRVSIVEIS